jgi:hypothetical protein
MMRSAKVTLLLAVAMCVFAGTAVSASALTKEGHFYKKGVKLAEGVREKVTSKGGVSKLESTVKLECQKLTDKGWVENPAGGGNGKDEAEEITFTECIVVGASACKVKSVGSAPAGTIIVEKIPTEVVKLASLAFGDLFVGPSAEETFVELEITGAECAAKGKYKVKGNVVGKANGNKLEFTNPAQEGSTLKLGSNAATLIVTDEQNYVSDGSGVEAGA